MSTVSASAITGIFPYRIPVGGVTKKYVLFVQGTTFKVLDTGTGTVTTPTVRGAAVASSAKGNGFFANNRFHYGNGTDQKWFDGTNWRTSGLPVLTAAQIQNITVTEGVRELTVAQAASVTLTAAGGGSFPADTLTGHLIYLAIFDISNNEIGPATISVGSGRIKLTLNQEIQIAAAPNLSGVNTNWVMLAAGTIDGGNLAFFFTNTNTGIQSYVRAGTTITWTTVANHGLSTGDVVIITNPDFPGVYKATSTGLTTFTTTIPISTGSNAGGGGIVERIPQIPNGSTSVNILAPTQDTAYQVNQNLGLAASTIGGPNAGYQFYASIYNPNGGGHVGNRIAIGGRALQTAYRSNWHLAGLPDLSGTDTEWTILLGRTGDGAQVPYPCADNAVNWAVVPSAQTTFTINQANIDGQHELPSRNGIIPSQCSMFCLAGDYAYAADPNSPTLRRSGSFLDDRAGTFTGRPEQSWAPNDIDTFPTAEPITGIFEIDQEVFCGTLHDSALSVNLAGLQFWAAGPWAVGIAGPRAGTKCGSQGFFWISGDKQLCTFSQGVPVGVSDEYELAELSQIGSQFLSTVECVYYRNIALNKEELRIEAQKADGTPYTIIHDFKDREVYSAPGSLYGQGYSSQFTGPLATVFTSALVRDGNGALQVYAGASTGQLYQLYTGADDAGNQYTADLILLAKGGPNRPSIHYLNYYGDQNILITLGRNFSSSLAAGAQWGFDPPNSDANVASSFPGAEQDFLYRVELTPSEIQNAYIRFQLTSHSADGNLSLNSPVHIPLENYGRLYEIFADMDGERGR